MDISKKALLKLKTKSMVIFTRWLTFIVLGWCCLSPVFGETNFSLTLDGSYSRVVSGFVGHRNGLGGSLMFEVLPADSFSLGVGLDTVDYWGSNTPNPVLVESVNLFGRYILNPGDAFTFYLTGGGGFNPQVGFSGTGTWTGDFHLMGGVGTWMFLTPRLAIDFAGLYDYSDLTGNSLGVVQAKVGLSYFFADAQKNKTKATSTPLATPTPTQTVVMNVQSDVADPQTGAVKKAVITTNLENNTNIQKWEMQIKDQKGTTLQTYEGRGVPPKQFVWEAKDSSGNLMPQGAIADYRFTATDNQGKIITSEGPLTAVPTPPQPGPLAMETPVGSATVSTTPVEMTEVPTVSTPVEQPGEATASTPVEKTEEPIMVTPTIGLKSLTETLDQKWVWWNGSFEPKTLFEDLKIKLVPEYIQSLQIAPLGQKALRFFGEMKQREYRVTIIRNMRASYYAAVAEELQKKGLPESAAFYLDLALKIQSTNKDAQALQGKIKAPPK